MLNADIQLIHIEIILVSSTRFGGRVPRSGSEQQLPRAETHSDFGRHSLLRSSLKASAAAGGS